MSCSPDPDANLDKAADRVREAARGGANIVCLPELFRAQYFCQREDAELFDLAESIPGPSTERLAAVAQEEKVVVVASLFERRAAASITTPSPYCRVMDRWAESTARCISPTTRSTTRSSISPPATWASGLRYFSGASGRAHLLGPVVPGSGSHHRPARSQPALLSHRHRLASRGKRALRQSPVRGVADHPAFPCHRQRRLRRFRQPRRPRAWRRRGNRAPGVGLEFWGGSFIADPFGRVLAQAPHDSEAILIEEVDLKHLEDTRRNWPFLRDRRIDSYPPITARFLDDVH